MKIKARLVAGFNDIDSYKWETIFRHSCLNIMYMSDASLKADTAINISHFMRPVNRLGSVMRAYENRNPARKKSWYYRTLTLDLCLISAITSIIVTF